MIDNLVDFWFDKRLRPSLFKMSAGDPEIAHEAVMGYLQRFQRHKWLRNFLQWRNLVTSKKLQTEAFGIRFPNPIGLAAGFDKCLSALRALAALGFGFVEGGAITPLPQEGNPRPRIERDEVDKTIWNSMGFNNPGVEIAKDNLKIQYPLKVPLGINLGKGKDTPLEKAIKDYEELLEELYLLADYFTVNVSSPNTPGLRDLQGAQYLEELAREVARIADELAGKHGLLNRKPILFKFAPDMTDGQLDQALGVTIQYADGVILANTRKEERNGRAGGRSGPAIFGRALEMVSFASRHTEGKFPIIGSGGIDCADRAHQMLEAGAWLIQVLTVLIFKGPTLPRRLAKQLKKLG